LEVSENENVAMGLRQMRQGFGHVRPPDPIVFRSSTALG
jgi:hypothetical protein